RVYAERHMGVEVRLIIYGDDELAANDAAAKAFSRVRQLDQTFSDYNSDSEAMRLCRTAIVGQPVAVSEDFWKVMLAAKKLSKASEGAFDVTIGPVTKLWRRARRRLELPEPALL